MHVKRSDTHGRRKKKRSSKTVLVTVIAIAILAAGASYAWKKTDMNRNQAAEEHNGPPKSDSASNAHKGNDGSSEGNNNKDSSLSDKPTGSGGQGNQGDNSQSGSPKEETGKYDGGSAIKLAFTGDIMFAGKVENIMKKYGYAYPYTEVKPFLLNADLTIANLETPITARGEIQPKEYVYRSSPDALQPMMEAGIDLVNMANNHIIDYGEQGLSDTFDYLDKIGLKRVGAGRDIDEAYKPVIMKANGKKIAFLGFSRVVPDGSWKAGIRHPGVADTYNYSRPVEAIKQAKQQADLVVVIAHWGVERGDTPENYQIDLAHRYIDAGADLIVGSHAHVLQSFEQYEGKWIAYGLGNFIFTTNNVEKTWETVILQAECSDNNSCGLKLVPIVTKYAKPIPMDEQASAKLFRRLTNISIGAEVKPDGTIVGTNGSANEHTN